MRNIQWWLPIVLMAVITPFTPSLDLTISHYFYNEETHQFYTNAFFNFLYEYGPVPGDATAIGATIFFLLSFVFLKLKRWRSSALILVLTMVLGAGFITHALLKDHWGRPRPKQVVEFGGLQNFRPYYSPNFFHQSEPSKSFACGHCSTGFYFFALAIVGRRLRSSRITALGFLLAFGLGISLSVMRIAQGGHFFSDTLASALIMWLTALTLDWMIVDPQVKKR